MAGLLAGIRLKQRGEEDFVIYEKGDRADFFYIILDGEVTLRLPSAGGLSLVIDDRLPAQARFTADRRALRQALHPLVANAVKFTERGEVVVRLDRAGDGVCIRVSDTGCGIEPSILPDLFEAFAQGDASIRRNHSGMGLGLALAARHVRRVGGRIDVDSRVGEGSTFTVTLPVSGSRDLGGGHAA